MIDKGGRAGPKKGLRHMKKGKERFCFWRVLKMLLRFLCETARAALFIFLILYGVYKIQAAKGERPREA